MGAAAHVRIHVVRVGDADEQRLAVARRDVEAQLAERVGADVADAGADQVEVEVLADERAGGRAQLVVVGDEVAVGVLLAVDPEHGAAADADGEAEGAEQDGGDVCRPRRRGRGGGVAVGSGDMGAPWGSVSGTPTTVPAAASPGEGGSPPQGGGAPGSAGWG